ncbi:hypothetical protein VDG1235_829 [Verrucomicrobiia bacterium DG1235]|nr:hypothetical protein VDG1235_829 [Verrucomicrobiae bacterium DG1235]
MQEIDINWDTLERLRNRFLDTAKPAGVYWQSEEDLAHYHHTFAARIGWKWDNALAEANQAGFQLQARRILDWGCGSGIATLRVLAHFGPDAIDEVLLWDHSLAACRFAKKTIRDAYPNLKVEIAAAPSTADTDTLVLVSHALTELSQDTQDALAKQISSAAQILVVEPGDYSASRKLIALRETLRTDFHIAAPCTQCEACPMLTVENGRHWCHFFGKPPVEAFTESFWARFAQLMEIDLRSLPYSFLAVQNKTLSPPHPSQFTIHPSAASRLIGRPRQFKGYTRLLSCDSAGIRDLELQKRDDKQLWKALKKGPASTLFQWTEIEDPTARLKSGRPL